MCRHLAWLGESRSVADLVLDPPFGLLRQSYAPRMQSHGTMNADGWGVGFFDAAQSSRSGRPEPVRWRSSRPLWTDPSFASVAPVLRSGAVLAAVRSATVGMPADETAAAPFTDGRWLVSHNGRVDRAVLPATHSAESVCDAAVLAAHVLERGPDRLAATVREVGAADPAGRLSLLLIDGERILATTWGDPLHYLVLPGDDATADDATADDATADDATADDATAAGVVVASEPYDDDPRWVVVPDRHHLEVTADGAITVTPMEP